MTAVIKTNVIPDFLRRVSSSGAGLSSLGPLRFYMYGGFNVVAIEKMDATTFNVFVPEFSAVDHVKATDLVRGVIAEINAGMALHNIKHKQYFLFDTKKLVVILEDSYVDWVPYQALKYAFFMEQGGSDVYFLSDRSDYGILQAASIFFAKSRLIRPRLETNQWTQVGKLMLNYFVAKTYNLVGSFDSVYGSWDGVLYSFPNDHTPPEINVVKLKIGRAMTLASNMVKFPSKDKEDNIDEKFPLVVTPKDIGKGVGRTNMVLLSEIVQMGVKAFVDAQAYGMIDVELDMASERIDKVRIDCVRGIVYVKPTTHSGITQAEAEEIFQTDNIFLVNSMSVIDIVDEGKDY